MPKIDLIVVKVKEIKILILGEKTQKTLKLFN